MSIEKPTQSLLDSYVDALSKTREFARKISEFGEFKETSHWKSFKGILNEYIDLNKKGILQELDLRKTSQSDIAASYVNLAQMSGVVKLCEGLISYVDKSDDVLATCRESIKQLEEKITETEKAKEQGVF